MNKITTPAKVTRIKASHPVYEHGDDGDNRSASGNVPMGLAAAMPFLIVLLGVGGLAAWAIYF